MFNNKNLITTFGVFFIIFMSGSHVHADTEYRVKSTDNLNRIVDKFYQRSELTRSQILFGILAENPDAFKGGNINFLMQGKRLWLPDDNKLTFISDEDAKELLAEHAEFFRNGITGDLKSLTSKDTLSSGNTKALENNQIMQTEKISRLEKESEELRVRLEKLVEEKTASDEKLREIEEALKKSMNQSPVVDNSLDNNSESLEAKKKLNNKVNINAQKLQETNRALLQQLQESKSELAENARATITLEREITNLQDKDNQNGSSKPVIDSIPSSAANNSSLRTYTDTQMSMNENGPVSKYIWPLLALLLVSSGLIFWRWLKNHKMAVDDENLKQAIESTYINENSYIEAEYQEEPLGMSIKLDVAKAYLEAQDTDSALNILREVIAEGNAEQKRQAENILATLQQAV